MHLIKELTDLVCLFASYRLGHQADNAGHQSKQDLRGIDHIWGCTRNREIHGTPRWDSGLNR